MNKQDIKESLLVFGIFTGTLLPLRLVFYDYLSHYWIGSFGITSLFVFLIFYLSKKGKLGKIGLMITSKIEKRAKGKLGKFTIIQSIFLIYLCSIIVLGCISTDQQATNFVMDKFHKNGINNIQTLETKSKPVTTSQTIAGVLILLTPNALSFLCYKIINELSNGLVLSFFTVFLIDEIEILGLALYFRYKKHDTIIK